MRPRVSPSEMLTRYAPTLARPPFVSGFVVVPAPIRNLVFNTAARLSLSASTLLTRAPNSHRTRRGLFLVSRNRV